jgi:acyl-coenzyme A thioesterase PaaI-like protein
VAHVPQGHASSAQLQAQARVTRKKDRKVFVEGSLTSDAGVLAKGKRLWIVLRDDATPEKEGVVS